LDFDKQQLSYRLCYTCYLTSASARHKPAMQGMQSRGGRATALWLTFLESSRQTDVELQLTCNAATYRFLRDSRSTCQKLGSKFRLWDWDFDCGSRGYRLQRGEVCPGPICTIMQNFTPIGATVAEISVTGQRKTQQLIYHINVWRVINDEIENKYC